MMKTALLSVHSDPNYGSMLQAYALSAALNKLGCENEYINYEPYKKQNILARLIKRIIKILLVLLHIKKSNEAEYSFWSSPEFRNQKELFGQFHRVNIPTSKIKYYRNTIHKANDIYRCFVIGSDQTWSPLLSSNPYSISFLPFVDKESIKCSYAPSIGTTHITKEYLEVLKENLASFKHLSCREYANADLLSSYIGKKVEYVLDPTLLLTKHDWLMLSEPIDLPKQFVLCYILGMKDNIYKYASKLADQKKLSLYIIVTRPEYINYPNALKDVSVGQFLSLINQASYVVTDSFHGSLFSINMGTNFFAFTKRCPTKGMNDNDRIGDFLNVIGLDNRFKADNDQSIEDDIDFESVYNKIDKYRRISYSYLEQIVYEK